MLFEINYDNNTIKVENPVKRCSSGFRLRRVFCFLHHAGIVACRVLQAHSSPMLARLPVQDGAGTLSPGRRGDGPPSIKGGDAGSARSSHSRVPLSARSATSAISMHINSYSYLSERAYDFLHARSSWQKRVHDKQEGDDSEQSALKVGTNDEGSTCLEMSFCFRRPPMSDLAHLRLCCVGFFGV